jgi:hypothetical protein
MARMHVNAGALNIRKSAGLAADALVSLPFGHPVDTLGPPDLKRWIEVEATYRGKSYSGFVNSGYLRAPVSEARERLLAVTASVWDKFQRGDGKENKPPFASYIGEMWRDVGHDADGKDANMPWAGAFLAHVLKHAAYTRTAKTFPSGEIVHAAVRFGQIDPQKTDFDGVSIEAHVPAVGDLIFMKRGVPPNIEQMKESAHFKCHCDVIVACGMTQVWAVGGNINNSVSLVRYPLTSNDLLDPKADRAVLLLRNLH